MPRERGFAGLSTGRRSWVGGSRRWVRVERRCLWIRKPVVFRALVGDNGGPMIIGDSLILCRGKRGNYGEGRCWSGWGLWVWKPIVFGTWVSCQIFQWCWWLEPG
jgi:hypothetical protein